MGEGRDRPVNNLQTTKKGPMKVVSQQDDTYELLDLVNELPLEVWSPLISLNKGPIPGDPSS